MLYLCIEEFLNDHQIVGLCEMVRLPLVGIVWSDLEVQGLELVVRVDGDSALEAVYLEHDHAGLAGLDVGEVLLGLDDVLQLAPDEDTAEEPVEGAHHAAAAAARHLARAAQLVKRLGGERRGHGGGPQLLGQDPGRGLVAGGGHRAGVRGGARVPGRRPGPGRAALSWHSNVRYDCRRSLYLIPVPGARPQ